MCGDIGFEETLVYYFNAFPQSDIDSRFIKIRQSRFKLVILKYK